jgi:vacuolar-type H+-ATPase subunit E/Vma4
MALADLLRAIEAEAEAERARADREAAAEAAAIVESARVEASALEAALADSPEAEARAEAAHMRALARLDATAALRSAREHAFVSVLDGIGKTLAALRTSEGYPALFEALVIESRAVLPFAGELRVDRRDAELALPLARGLRIERTLETLGGVELASDDGRTVKNTVEERLANAEPLLRQMLAQRLLPAWGRGIG